MATATDTIFAPILTACVGLRGVPLFDIPLRHEPHVARRLVHGTQCYQSRVDTVAQHHHGDNQRATHSELAHETTLAHAQDRLPAACTATAVAA